jgi:hypothetical protein
MKTFTTLNLCWNKIDAKGAQHLAQALQSNTVRQLVFLSTAYLPLSFNIDTHHAQA